MVVTLVIGKSPVSFVLQVPFKEIVCGLEHLIGYWNVVRDNPFRNGQFFRYQKNLRQHIHTIKDIISFETLNKQFS